MARALNLDFVRRFVGGGEVAAKVEVDVDASPVTVLFGPSGAGKTTILRCIAGLEAPDDGRIALGAETWFDSASGVDVRPQDRRIGFVEQGLSLFPHMTVAANVGFPMRGLARRERSDRVLDLLSAVGVAELAGRRPSEISGGQRQRVAIARALARDPRLLLLDEPFSSLDARAAAPARALLLEVVRDRGVPAVLVTHDRDDAMATAGTVVVVAGGAVLQQGSPDTVFGKPESVEVAEIVGVETVVQASVVGRGDGVVTLAPTPAPAVEIVAVCDGPLPDDVLACIRAEDVSVATEETTSSSARNRLPGVVTAVAPAGPAMRVTIDCGFAIDAIVTRQSVADLHLVSGRRATAVVKAPSVHIVARPEATAPAGRA